MSHTVVDVIAVIAIVAYVIGRQLLGEPLRGKHLIVLPLTLILVGSLDLGKDGRQPRMLDDVFIVASGLLAAGIGLAQGSMIRLDNRDGGLWGRMPVRSLWLWVALIASRVLLGVVAAASGAHVAASSAPILLTLGINRLAQAAAITARAMRAGIPFAPEQDGSRLRTRRSTPAPTEAHSPTTPVATSSAAPPATAAEAATTASLSSAPAEQPVMRAVPADTGAGTWHSTGQQMMTGLGGALADRRSQRGRRDRGERRRR